MEGTVLHRVVRDHLETFLRPVTDRGAGGGLPFPWRIAELIATAK